MNTHTAQARKTPGRLIALLMALLLFLPTVSAGAEKVIPDGTVTWAKEQANEMIADILALMEDPNYLGMNISAGAPPEQTALLNSWKDQLLKKKPSVLIYPMPSVEAVLDQTGEGGAAAQYRGMGEVAKRRVKNGLPFLLVNLSRDPSSFAAMLAANLVQMNRNVAKPADFLPLMLLYVYEDTALLFSFQEHELGVGASAMFTTPKMQEVLNEVAP